jgi:hypothetical protein
MKSLNKSSKRIAIATPRRQKRFAALDVNSINEQERTIQVSFSSETRDVAREDEYFGMRVPEVLLHSPGAVDLEPVRNIGSVLKNHDPNQNVGYPLSVGIKSRRGVAILKFGTTAKADEVWREVLDKTLRGISVGYKVLEMVRVHAGESFDGVEGPAVVATKWRVLEITLTPIPADASVGVGRSQRSALRADRKENMSKQVKRPAGQKRAKIKGSFNVESGDLAQDVNGSDYTDESDEGRQVTGDEGLSHDADASEEAAELNESGRDVVVDEDDDESELNASAGEDNGDTAADGTERDGEMCGTIRPGSPTGAPRSRRPQQRSVDMRRVEQRARLAERDRIAGIRQAVRNANLDEVVAERLIERGASVAGACTAIVRELGRRDVGPVSRGARVQHGADASDKILRHMAVNLSRRMGNRYDETQKAFVPIIDLTPEEQKVERQGVRMMDLARTYLQLINFPGWRAMGTEEMARAIFSPDAKYRASAGNVSGSIANILANIQNKAMLKAYTKAAPTWRRWCKIGSTPDFKQAYRLRLSDFADLRQTDENGEILDSQIGDEKEALTLAVYARRISLTWQMFVNDDLDALGSLPAKMGQAAARLPSRLVYTHLLANPTMNDGIALFQNAGTHKNWDTTATALGATTLKTAITDMRKQTSIQAPNDSEFASEPLDVNPAILLVPPELEVSAKQIAFSPGDVTAQLSANVINVYRDIIREVVVESRLSNSSYSGNSATAWYLIGDPASVDTLEVTFLDGNEAPRTDVWEDFDRLAMQFRAYLPCTAKALDWRGIHKSTGA